MSDIQYDGNIVNATISEINNISNKIPSLSASIRSATNQIVSARGFSQYVGGISSDSFSGVVDKCQDVVVDFVKGIRDKQVKVLAYSQDQGSINAFLDSLDRSDYEGLDLSALSSYIGIDRAAGNILKGVGATALTAGLGVVEGLGDLLETGADLITLAGTGVASIFTGIYDLLNGTNQTEKMWQETKAWVSDKKVENIFNSLYNDTDFGKYVKNNAYGFDTVRGISKGLGYTAGMIGLTAVTGGLASGLGIGASGSISAGQLALTAGTFGFANGTEEAWADGADIGQGLLYGAATGAWEGAQWFAGAKINQFGGLGDKIAKGIFKGAAKGVGIRIGMDTVDSALDGFVRPALSMIYKDYGKGDFVENYKTAFEAAGGWANVRNQAIMGGIASAIGEYSGARRLLKEAKQTDSAMDAKKIFQGEGGNAGKEINTLRNLDTGEEMFAPASYKRVTTIDGDWVHNDKTIFNSVTGNQLPSDYRWFSDGAYLPSERVLKNASPGILGNYESRYIADDMISIIEKSKKCLSAAEYNSLMEATNIFKYAGCDVSANELKLICFHSEGNAGRIRSVLSMTHGEYNSGTLDQLADQLSKTIFKSKMTTPLSRITTMLTNDMIDSLRRNGTDDWLSASKIFDKIDSRNLISQLDSRQLSLDGTTSLLKTILPDSVSDNALREIASSDGLAPTIRKILENSGMKDAYDLDLYSANTAAKVFSLENVSRMKAVMEIGNGNYDTALSLVSRSGDYIKDYHELFKSTGFFGTTSNRMAYYSLIDRMTEDGLDLSDAVFRSKYINSSALIDIGKKDISLPTSAVPIKSAKDMIFKYQDDVISTFDNTPLRNLEFSDYTKSKYMVNGKVSASMISNDFESMMKRNLQNIDQKMVTDAGLDYQRTIQANKFLMQSYLDAVSDTSNPNRGEALRCMAKMLELDSQGKAPIIINNGGFDGSFNNKRYINLGIPTLDGSQSSVVFHESGHYFFSEAYNSQMPSQYPQLRKTVASSFDNSSNVKNTLQTFANNNAEIQNYTNYLATKELRRYAIDQGYSGIDGYRQYLINKYSNTAYIDRSDLLKKVGSQEGMIQIRTFSDQGFGKNLDVKDATKLADIELYTRKNKIQDKVYSDLFPDYQSISDIIDATSKGTTYINYGHGPGYFDKPVSENLSFNEILADYTSMKVRGDNRSIRTLRYLLGDQFVDMIDSTYQNMLK